MPDQERIKIAYHPVQSAEVELFEDGASLGMHPVRLGTDDDGKLYSYVNVGEAIKQPESERKPGVFEGINLQAWVDAALKREPRRVDPRDIYGPTAKRVARLDDDWTVDLLEESKRGAVPEFDRGAFFIGGPTPLGILVGAE